MSDIHPESAFAYHGLDTGQTSDRDVIKSLIKSFLEDVNFDRHGPLVIDAELEAAVWAYFKSQNLGQKVDEAVRSVLKLSVTLTINAYQSLPFENKVLCAIQFLYMFLVDDIAISFIEELRSFCQNFTLNNDHHQPLLNGFDKHLRYLGRFYGPYCHSTIIKSTFDYVNGRIIEHEMEKAQFKFSAETRLMPMFLRTKVGAAEILISLLWPKAAYPEREHLIRFFPVVQELIIFTDFTNDILSYYKEFVIDQETGNFVANFSETHGMSHVDVLKHLTKYTPKVLRSVHEILRDRHDMQKIIKDYINGWIVLCTSHRRYRLVELFADEGYLPSYCD
ncbi:Trichodiene synthase [Penicillium ucsense]|uniref:Trichodiene synthase n=1 Tax=Penicillium ucsense TaxID=2839758 RepID=A0A8J8WIP4_9EURO|nr:Trichodiene synthase [Penicillium ucsense]KAF7735019.1 Trichodiene synthase [Penicillium ucsense]